MRCGVWGNCYFCGCFFLIAGKQTLRLITKTRKSMKFWELVSAFRSERENIASVLESPKWAKINAYFQRLDEIVKSQNREILDVEVPFQLAREVCERSKMEFYLYHGSTPQILRSRKINDDGEFEMLSALEVLLRFGGEAIEEALEKGSSTVPPKELEKAKTSH